MSGIKVVMDTSLLIKRIVSIGKGAPKHLRKVFREEMDETLLPLLKENLSCTCHTLRDLRDLDHPYAPRHGGKAATASIVGHEADLVHKQSSTFSEGTFVAALKTESTVLFGDADTELYFEAYINKSDVNYAEYVIDGTWKMIARNPGPMTLAEAIPLIKMNLINSRKFIFQRGVLLQ